MLKSFFGAAKQAKRDDADLGRGVWRRAHDRFRRGLDRFHQMLEGLAETGPTGAQTTVQATETYEAVVVLADALSALLPTVRAIAAEAQKIAPSEGMEIPVGTGGYLNDVHRELSRAGNALAAAAEALALVRLGVGEAPGVELKVGIVSHHVQLAQDLLHRTTSPGQ